MAATVKSSESGNYPVERPVPGYLPERRESYGIARPQRRLGLMSSITSALFHPWQFFGSLSRSANIALIATLILVLSGVAAVRVQPSASAPPDSMPEPVPMMPDVLPNPGGGLGGQMGGSLDFSGIPGDLGGMPPGEMPGSGQPESAADVTQTTITALTAAVGVLLGWFALAGILLIVPMLRGRAPQFSTGLQIAIWATLPLAIMVLVQFVYQALGGTIGAQMGVTVLLNRWDGFAALPSASQALLTSLASQITIFSVWSVIMVYAGARTALRGSRAAALIAIILWITVAAIAPSVPGLL